MKIKSFRVFVFSCLLVLSLSLISNATTYWGECGKNSANNIGGSGSDFYVNASYDIGSAFPFDDAYAVATSGAKILNDRYGEYCLTASDGTTTKVKCSKYTYSGIGSGVQQIRFEGGLPSYDTATGFIYAAVYRGHGDGIRSLYKDTYLRVKD